MYGRGQRDIGVPLYYLLPTHLTPGFSLNLRFTSVARLAASKYQQSYCLILLDN